MYIKKIRPANCELIPQIFLNKNKEGRKKYQPLSQKFMWLQKYIQSQDPMIEARDQFQNFDEFIGYTNQTEQQPIERDFIKKIKPCTSISKENQWKSRLIDINPSELNILYYNNDNKKMLMKQKQNLESEDSYRNIMGVQNNLNLHKKTHCKSTEIQSKKYETYQTVLQISARKRENMNHSNNVGEKQKHLVRRLQFKKSKNLLNKQLRLPTSKTTRRVINPSSNHDTINIKNICSERTNQRKYSVSQKTYRKKPSTNISNKQNEMVSIQFCISEEDKLIQQKCRKFSTNRLENKKNDDQKKLYMNKYNSQRRTKKKTAINLEEIDNNVELNPWNHQQSSMSCSQINLLS